MQHPPASRVEATSDQPASAELLVRRMGHDFNNLFSIILGGLALLREEIPAGSWSPDANETFNDVLSAAHEAADVVANLTAWAARQAVEPKDTDLNAVARELAPLLSRGLPEGVSLALELSDAPVCAWVDRDRLQSAILELVANAREAMANGGELRIETAPGPWPELRVADTGKGMDAAELEQCRQPYVSFNRSGSHRGLGLSVVDGFARASGGALVIDSAPGRGTVVALRLAACAPAPPGERGA